MGKETLQVIDLGRKGYQETYELQKELVIQRYSGKIPDTLVLVEHPSVFTIGRGGTRQHLLISDEVLKNLGIEVFEIDRGGDITYHGPGQIVGYPILDLNRYNRDVHWVIRSYEQFIINILAEYGIQAERNPGYTGVWVGDEKICAIGIGARHWVTFHGFALNVRTDMNFFRLIIPCGITDKGVTSLSLLLGEEVDTLAIKQRIINRFAETFGLEVS